MRTKCVLAVAARVAFGFALSIGGVAQNASTPRVPTGSTVYKSLTLSRFGHRYTVLLYTTHDREWSATVMVYDRSLPVHDAVLLSDTMSAASSFAQPTGLMKLLGTDEQQIVVYRLIGASCEGVLDIYRIESATVVVKLSTPWSGSGMCQDDVRIEDLNDDGIPEITFRTNTRSSVRAVYRWKGTEYKRDDDALPHVEHRAGAKTGVK